VLEPSFIFYTPTDFFQKWLFVGAYHKKLCKTPVIMDIPHCEAKPTCYDDKESSSFGTAYARFLDSQVSNYPRDATLLLIQALWNILQGRITTSLTILFEEIPAMIWESFGQDNWLMK
jgi:hypothetical protein